MNCKTIFSVWSLLLGLIFSFSCVDGMDTKYHMRHTGEPGCYSEGCIGIINLYDSERDIYISVGKIEELKQELDKYDSTAISDLQLASYEDLREEKFDGSKYPNLKRLAISASLGEIILPGALEELTLGGNYVGQGCTLDLSVCKNFKAFYLQSPYIIRRAVTRFIFPPSLVCLDLGYDEHKYTVEGLEYCNSLSDLSVNLESCSVDIPSTIKFLDISGRELDLLDLSRCSQLVRLRVKFQRLKKLILPLTCPEEYDYCISDTPYSLCEIIENKPEGIKSYSGMIVFSRRKPRNRILLCDGTFM